MDAACARSSASTGTSCGSPCGVRVDRSCSSWASAATSRCGRRSSAQLHARGFQTIAYDASGTGHSPPRLVPLRPHGLARQAAHLLDALGLPAGRRPRRLLRRRGGPGARRCATRTGCDGWSSPRRRAGSAASPAPRSRSACSPRRCATTRPASCRRPPAGCTDRSRDPRRKAHAPADARPPVTTSDAVGLRRASCTPSPAGRASRGCTASPRRHSCSAAARTRSSRRSTPASSAPRIPDATVHVVPDAGHLLLMDHAVESAELITRFLRSDEPDT